VIGDRELPGVGEKDRDDFAGLEPRGDESASEGLNVVAVFGVRETAVAGRVNESSFAGNAAAGFQNDVVNEAAGRIGVQLGAKHPGRL